MDASFCINSNSAYVSSKLHHLIWTNNETKWLWIHPDGSEPLYAASQFLKCRYHAFDDGDNDYSLL